MDRETFKHAQIDATAQNALAAAQRAALATEERRRRAMLCAWGSVTAMALVVVGYLFDIYTKASLIVAALSTLIVAATIAIPYKIAQRMCARKSQRLAVAGPD